ncbi:MAG: hypothetical protein JSR77_01875 [Planctomycetes bacterium]|nr:hypothetical protein [Planctomycetota bacterium]
MLPVAAQADVVGNYAPGGSATSEESRGYGPRVTPLRGVNPNDRVSVGLVMYDSSLNPVSVNSGGDALVQRSVGSTDLGTNRNGSGHIQAFWDELIVNNAVVIRCAISTTNGEALVPATATVPRPGGGSSPASFWSWRFGTSDPVNYQSYVTNVLLRRASISFSSDGGQSYSNTITHTTTIPNRANWNPGVDDGELLASVGDGTNYVLLQYEIEVTPTPGTLALLAGGMFSIGRRGRRR